MTNEEMERWTEEMDGIFTEEDRKNKYNAYVQCKNCAKWSFIIGTRETYGNISSRAQCQHCGSKDMDPRSTISKRTFNPAIHNKRKVK